MDGRQPDRQRDKTGDVKDKQPDRDGEQIGVDLARRTVDLADQPP
jgi:hypothetical protein